MVVIKMLYAKPTISTQFYILAFSLYSKQNLLSADFSTIRKNLYKVFKHRIE